MNEEVSPFEEKIVDNIRKIMVERRLTQAALADFLDVSESQFSKILNKKHQLSILQLEKIARGLSMKEIDIITYPQVYVEKGQGGDEPIEAILQIKLKKDKKDQVLNLIFGEHNLEIFDK